jgi:ketosteroid isomerase-like protein
MRHVILVLLSIVLIAGCKAQKLTNEQIATEKKAIEGLITKFHSAYEAKDVTGITDLFSKGELMFFGTDSAEVLKNASDVQKEFKADSELVGSAKLGTVQNLSIQVASMGDLASAVYEVPGDLVMADKSSHALIRFAMTFKKENNVWKIVQGEVAVATTGQSSAELVEKMKAAKKK